MEVQAKARFIRISPRKVRLVVDVVRGLPVAAALTQLRFLNKAAALPVRKMIESAIANAEHNFKLSKDNLYIKAIAADAGPTIHRFRPRAFGRAAPIRKRMTHISVILDELAGKKIVAPAAKPKAAPAAAPAAAPSAKKAKAVKPVKKPAAKAAKAKS
jgi:large subunit ribosomal protein L22